MGVSYDAPGPRRGDTGDNSRAAVEILGVPITAWSADELIDAVVRWIGSLPPNAVTILYANVHVLNEACRIAELREQLRSASTVYCDGSGVRLGIAMLGHRFPPRLTGADWIDTLCAQASRDKIPLFLLG